MKNIKRMFDAVAPIHELEVENNVTFFTCADDIANIFIEMQRTNLKERVSVPAKENKDIILYVEYTSMY
jgi:hypothetical protein